MKIPHKVVLIIHNPFTNDSRIMKQARSLVNAGFSVEVLALYAEGLALFEEKEGYRVRRIKRWTNRIPGIRFIPFLRYAEFLWKVSRWYKDYDLMQCNDLETLPIAWLAKKWNKNIKVIYDAHEWEIDQVWMKSWMKKPAKLLEKILLPIANQVITVSDGIADLYNKVYGIEIPKVVLNCPHTVLNDKNNTFRETFNIASNSIIFLYQGGLSKGRNIEELLDAFSRYNKEDKSLVFLGYGDLQDYVKKKADENENIYFHPAVSPNELSKFTSSADIGLVTIPNLCLSFYHCFPNKFFEYINYGLPVIVNNLPEMTRVVNEYGIGEIINDVTVDELIPVIENMTWDKIEHFKKSLPQVAAKYNWEQQEKVYLQAYRQLIQ